MADGRMLKKNVSTSRKLASLKSDSARLLWTWLLPHLDVAGRFSAEPDVVKGLVMPRLMHISTAKIQSLLDELHQVGLIQIYKIDSERYLEFIRFEDFQNLRVDRESESKIPAPPKNYGITPGGIPEESTVLKDKDKDKDKDEDKDAGKFDVFWNTYPKKVEKQVARKCWDRLIKTDKPEEVLTAAKAYADHLMAKGETKYIKNPSTFLNEGRWKDWLPGSEAQQSIGIDPFWSKP